MKAFVIGIAIWSLVSAVTFPPPDSTPETFWEFLYLVARSLPIANLVFVCPALWIEWQKGERLEAENALLRRKIEHLLEQG